jgi:superfamily II DNA helicase RecQ
MTSARNTSSWACWPTTTPGAAHRATATADPQTREDILHYLKLSDARVFLSSFDRPNLFYQVVEKHNAKKQLLDFINNEYPVLPASCTACRASGWKKPPSG